jgi:DNA-binding XRE family transcriptional regulator
MPDDLRQLVWEARRSLGMNQKELALALGVSRSTAQRIDAGRSTLGLLEITRLADLVRPSNADLAGKLCAYAAPLYEALGRMPPAPAAPATAPAAATVDSDLAVESVIGAAADAAELSPRAIRPAVAAAFARAQELGLSIEAVIRLLGAGQGPR